MSLITNSLDFSLAQPLLLDFSLAQPLLLDFSPDYSKFLYHLLNVRDRKVLKLVSKNTRKTIKTHFTTLELNEGTRSKYLTNYLDDPSPITTVLLSRDLDVSNGMLYRISRLSLINHFISFANHTSQQPFLHYFKNHDLKTFRFNSLKCCDYIYLKGFTNLKSLKLTAVLHKTRTYHLKFLPFLSSLETLEITGMCLLDFKIFKHISTLKILKSLHLSHIKITKEEMRILRNPLLEILNIYNCIIKPGVLEVICKHFPLLKKLSLRKNLTKTRLQRLYRLKNLQELTINKQHYKIKNQLEMHPNSLKITYK